MTQFPEAQDEGVRQFRQCPFCNEPILMAAIACKHCDEVLIETPERGQSMPAGLIALMVVYILVVLSLPIVAIAYGLSTLSPWEVILTILIWPAMTILVVGTFARRKWAWWGLIILQLIAVFLGVIDVISDWTQVFSTILYIGILWYLGTPKALAWFSVGWSGADSPDTPADQV